MDYPHGLDAPQLARDRALKKVETCERVIIVEGISDQIAVETLGLRQGRDLDAEGVVVLPVGGAQAALPYLREYGPRGQQLGLAGLCDEDAAETMRRGLRLAGVGEPTTTAEMAALGFHVCTRDLEDELIRALGTDKVEAAIEAQGDLASVQAFLKQPDWKGRNRASQLHRFFRSQGRRNKRYARVLLETVEPDHAPWPLRAVLAGA